uniref:CUB domain-containing protein n=1 Tax=Strongyloides stercoralis TaxID=6248 RepID=A0A0K0E7P8_STRER
MLTLKHLLLNIKVAINIIVIGSNELLVMLLIFLITSLNISAKLNSNIKSIDEINNDKINKPFENSPNFQNDISLITFDPKPKKPIYMPLEAISMDVIHHMDQDSECKEFMPGGMSGINEFASPRYPSLYPSNIDCVRIIYAPSGYDIILTFKNIFQIESSYLETLKDSKIDLFFKDNTKYNNPMIQYCPNDYLTIRDGRFSFSPLIARLCGNKLPTFNITLHSGFAWLHFHSDSLLQYTGFQANYELIKTKKSTHIQIPCYFLQVIHYDGIVNSTAIKEFYSLHRNNTGPLECVWQFSVPLKDMDRLKIAVFVEDFHLADPNDCTSNFVELYQGHVSELPLQRFCGTQVTHTYSNANSVYLKFYAHGRSQVEKLKLQVLYSTYAPYNNCTEHNMFSCGGDICIPEELKCNKRNNCLYQQDEYNCLAHQEIWDKIFSSSLASLIMLIICVFFIVLTLCIWYNPIKYYYRRSKKKRLYSFNFQKNIDIFTTCSNKDLNINNLSNQSRSSNSSQCNINSTTGYGPKKYSTPSPTIANKSIPKTKTIDMGSINDLFNTAQKTNSTISIVSEVNKKSLEIPERQCKISFQDDPINTKNYSKQENKKDVPPKSIIQLPQKDPISPSKKNTKKYNFKKQKLSNINSSLIADDFNIEINNLNFTTIDKIMNINNHHQNCKKNSDVTHSFLKPRRKQNYENVRGIDATTLHQSSLETMKKNNKNNKNIIETEYNPSVNRKTSLTIPSPRDSSCEPLIGRNSKNNV